MRSYRFYRKSTNQPIAGSTFMRGDDLDDIAVLVVDPSQKSEDGQPAKVISLRLVIKLASEHPHGAPLLVKEGSDFLISVTGNVLEASTDLSGLETSIFPEVTTLIYDLERTIDGKRKTIEQDRFTVIPDVAV
ncbi:MULTISPECIES: hypothetical protein [Cyanophyceae]|uniref:hypothetical protein n=1 Tax=Cyanophyceae TaxID=3028117 RepID=UPI00168741D7|nr:hypothetical protein [Trichocoleus sp. FACHB-40]MBD2005618.1 hypothetical protein [Trichocoleus sp. FACHB-40]